MKKKIAIILAIIMIVAVLSTVLVACGDSDEDSGDGTSIRFLYYEPNTTEAQNAMKAMFNKFTAETGIKVIPIPTKKDSYNKVIQTNMMTKKQADVFYLDQPMLGTYSRYCLNLDEGFFAEEGEEGLHLSDFYDVAVDTVKYNGNVLAVPFSLTTSILLYNKSLVSSVPKSWEEWRNMSVPSDVALFGGIGNAGYAGWYFQGFLKSAGGDLLSGNQVVFNNEKGVAAGQMIKDLYSKSPSGIRGSNNAFTNGKVMFVLAHNTDVYNYFSSNPSFSESNLGATLFIPQNEGGTSYSNIGGENIAINKNSKNIEACKQFVKFLLREENVDVAVENNFSAIKEYAKVRTSNPSTGAQYSKTLQDVMSVLLKQLETASARPTMDGWMTVNDLYLGDALADIIDNGADVKTALDKAADKATKNLKF